MPLSSYRGSTQDGSAGVQVAQAVNEDGAASGTIVAGVQVGNKTTYQVISRTGVGTVDAPTGGNLTTTGFGSGSFLCDLGNCLNVSTWATCTVASANLGGRFAWYDNTTGCIGMSRSVAYTSDPTLRLGNAAGDFVSPTDLLDVGTARLGRFFVDSLSAGLWSIYYRPV